MWDAKTAAPLLELKGHTRFVTSVAFSPDGARIVTGSWDGTARVWDAEMNGESEQLDYRIFHTRPRPDRHREAYEQARKDKDVFAAAFHLDRLLAYAPGERPTLLAERNEFQHNPILEARAAMHTPALKAEPKSWETVIVLAVKGDRLAMRLLAQKRIADGKPGEALPLLHMSMIGRRGDRHPPVEELLIADALLKLKKPDEARRYYQAAVDWLDRPLKPFRAAGIVSHGFSGILPVLGEMVRPVGDPRYNSIDWESWHEAEVFRAAVERQLQAAGHGK